MTYIIKRPPPINAPSHVNAHPTLQDFPNLNALGVNLRGYGTYILTHTNNISWRNRNNLP